MRRSAEGQVVSESRDWEDMGRLTRGTREGRSDWGTGRWTEGLGGSGDDRGSHEGRERSGEASRASRDTGCARSRARESSR